MQILRNILWKCLFQHAVLFTRNTSFIHHSLTTSSNESFKIIKKYFFGATCLVNTLTVLNLQSHNEVLPVAKGLRTSLLTMYVALPEKKFLTLPFPRKTHTKYCRRIEHAISMIVHVVPRKHVFTS